MSEDVNYFRNRTFWESRLSCPNCGQNLNFVTNSYQFENPLFSLFKDEVLHAESANSRLKYSKECVECHFPIEPRVDDKSGKIKLLFPTDWLLAKLDKSKWAEWKIKQLNSYVAGLLDPQASYFHDDNTVGHSFAKFVEKNIDFVQLSILDAGCGALARPIYLRNATGCDLFGIDPFESSFDGHFSNITAEFLPFRDKSFDLVIASSAVDHFFDWKKSLNEFERVLCPNGKLAIYQHFNGAASRYAGTLIGGRWYRIFQHGYLVELLDEFDDPFHTKISQTLGWDIEISRYLTALGFDLIDSELENGFSIWEKR